MPAASIAWRSAASASSQSAVSPTNLSGRVDELGLELVEAEVAQQLQHERQQAAQLVGELLGRAEDVRVVLGEAPRPQQAVHHARLLVAVHRAELEQPQRQLAVRPLPRPVDEHVHRAVHRLGVVLLPLVELHGRVHAVGVPLEVAADLEQVDLGDVGREDELVAGLARARRGCSPPSACGPGRPWGGTAAGRCRPRAGSGTGRARRRACGGRASPPPPAGGGGPRAPCGCPRRCRRCAAAAGCARRPASRRRPPACSLKWPEVAAGVLDVRAPAQVDEARAGRGRAVLLGLGRRVLVGAHRATCRSCADIGSVEASSMISSLKRWSAKIWRASAAGISSRTNAWSLVDDLAHAGVDAVEVLGRERGAVRQLEVVVEAVLDRRADAEGGVGEQVEHRLGQHVGRRVADRVEAPRAVGGDDGHAVAVVAARPTGRAPRR